MSHQPDWGYVLGTAMVLGILAVAAFYLTLFPYTEVLYQQNGTEAEAVAAAHDWLPSRVAMLYLGALGFPLLPSSAPSRIVWI